MIPCVSFEFVSQMTRNSSGANVSVAETFMNNVPNGASRKIKPYFQLSNTHISLCLHFWTGSADMEGQPLLCSSFTFTWPLSNSLHHLHFSLDNELLFWWVIFLILAISALYIIKFCFPVLEVYQSNIVVVFLVPFTFHI